jgi:predicted component of type VI protein secretion system
MATVSFQVIDGVDKGRAFEDLPTPVTIGREEGNVIRLNDERVSRFHAKIQEDHGHVVLTDLDSTNGSCVNGEPIQLRILKPGDQLTMGRTKLVFGTPAQIAASAKAANLQSSPAANDPTVLSGEIPAAVAASVRDTTEAETETPDSARGYPKLPLRLAPSQAAQLSEVIDFLHRALADATEVVHIPANAAEARLPLSSWQQIQGVLAILARYSREVAEPAESAEAAH